MQTTDAPPPARDAFRDLGLLPSLCAAVKVAGYTVPTPIQDQAIPLVLDGKDVLGCAQTGSGKTAAFALPTLHRLLRTPPPSGPRRVRALVLAPTRELAAQIGDCFGKYSAGTKMRHMVVFGGVNKNPQIRQLRSPPEVLVACPGRLLDLMQNDGLSLGAVEYLILDEADRMLDMGFIHDVRRVVKAVPATRQTLFFSATMPPKIEKLARDILTRPERIAVDPVSSTAEPIEQFIYAVAKKQKISLLAHLLKTEDINRALVFTRTKHGANRVVQKLERRDISARAIHGNKSQSAREKALKAFRSGEVRVLVATDIAARGIDVKEMSHVINYDLPNIAETYVHRVGRTGRAGAAGVAISMCDVEERPYLRDIERLIGNKIERRELEGVTLSDETQEDRDGARRGPKPPRRHGGGGGGGGGQRNRKPRGRGPGKPRGQVKTSGESAGGGEPRPSDQGGGSSDPARRNRRGRGRADRPAGGESRRTGGRNQSSSNSSGGRGGSSSSSGNSGGGGVAGPLLAGGGGDNRSNDGARPPRRRRRKPPQK